LTILDLNPKKLNISVTDNLLSSSKIVPLQKFLCACLPQAGSAACPPWRVFARITLYLPQPGYLELLSIYRLPSATL